MKYTRKYTKTELLELVAESEHNADKLLQAASVLRHDELEEELVFKALSQIRLGFWFLERLHEKNDKCDYHDDRAKCYEVEELLEKEYNFENSCKVWELYGALLGSITSARHW